MTGTGELERDLLRWQRSDAPTDATTVIPYTRFLERRAWRAKIAADFRESALALPVLPPRD